MPSSLNSSSSTLSPSLTSPLLDDRGIGSRLLGIHLRRQRHEVGIDIVLNFLILDVFREDQQGSRVVAREWRNGLGRACEAAENQGGAGCDESVAHGEISFNREFRPAVSSFAQGGEGRFMPETPLKSVQALTSKTFRIVAEGRASRKLSQLTGIPGPPTRCGLAWLRMSRRFGSLRLTRWHDRRQGGVRRRRERPAPHELLHMLRHFPINAVADLARQLAAPVESLLDQRLIGGRLPVTVDLLEREAKAGFLSAAS